MINIDTGKDPAIRGESGGTDGVVCYFAVGRVAGYGGDTSFCCVYEVEFLLCKRHCCNCLLFLSENVLIDTDRSDIVEGNVLLKI